MTYRRRGDDRDWHAARMEDDGPYDGNTWHQSKSGREEFARQAARRMELIDRQPEPIRRHINENGWNSRLRRPNAARAVALPPARN